MDFLEVLLVFGQLSANFQSEIRYVDRDGLDLRKQDLYELFVFAEVLAVLFKLAAGGN